MDNKQAPLKADEKTKIISSNAIPSGAGTPAPQPVKLTPSQQSAASIVPSKPSHPSSIAPYFKKGNVTAKRTIVAGAIGGGLLIGLLALTSFSKKPEDEVESNGATGKTGSVDTVSEGDMVSINTGHQVYTALNDNLSLEEARTIAVEQVGIDGLLMHNNELHLARSNEEFNALTIDEKLAVIENINVVPIGDEEVVTVPVEVNGQIMNLKIDPLHKTDLIQFGVDDNGQVFCIPQGRPAVALENISVGGDGTYFRTDPDSGELSVFTIEQIFTQIDAGGKAQVEVVIPGTDVVIEGTYMYGYVDSAYGDSQINTLGAEPVSGYGWGWDTDGDGNIDVYDEDFMVTNEPDPSIMPEYYETDISVDPLTDPASTIDQDVAMETKTDEELLNDRILQMAKEGGIDDISKIKKHQNDDGSWDIKIKGDDGEKIKTKITVDDLRSGQEEVLTGEVVDSAALNDDDVMTGDVTETGEGYLNPSLMADNDVPSDDPYGNTIDTSGNDVNDTLGDQSSQAQHTPHNPNDFI